MKSIFTTPYHYKQGALMLFSRIEELLQYFLPKGMLVVKLSPAYVLIVCLCSLSVKSKAQSTIVQLYNPPLTKVGVATGDAYMHFPRAFAFDTKASNGDVVKRILLSWGYIKDHPSITPYWHYRISPDEGQGYWATVTSKPKLNFGNALKKRDGTILAMPYLVVRDSSGVDERQFGLEYHTSTNDGVTFNDHVGTINFPFNVNWVKITRGIIEFEGALYMPLYAAYQGYPGSRCAIVKSTDQGQTWSWYADITHPDKDGWGVSYDEVTIAICANGEWLSVFRKGEYMPLKYCRSTAASKGTVWSPAAPLPGLPTTNQTNIDDYNESVDPLLQMLPNGIMILSYGRPNSHIAFSYDGNGTNWTYLATTFAETTGYLPGVNGKQSTNYLATVPLGYNKFMQYGDTGANWRYRNADGQINEHPSPNPFSIWQKPFEIVTNRQNRIDLKKKILNTVVTVMPATTLTYTTSARPETNTLGAVDGSMDYWSSAMAPSGVTSGVYQLDLQKTYQINSLGIGMLYEKQQSATVQYATAADPNTWVTIVSYTNAIHRNIKYTDFPPVEARYIKVTVSGSGGQIGIGELELYEVSSTFEGNAASDYDLVHGLIPYGYSFYGGTASKHGMSVRDIYGYHSNRALCLRDADATYMAGIKKIVSASNKKTLEFRFRPTVIPASQFISMRILGTVSNVENTVFYLAVMPDGSIKANQGGGFTVPVAAAGTIAISPTSPWRTIKIAADEASNIASVYLDNLATPVGTFTMFSTPSSTSNLTGFGFTSYGTATYGEIAYFDDINFYDPTVSGGSGIAAIAPPSEILTSNLTDISAREEFSISLSPNPTSDLVKITARNFSNGALAIYFTDMFGKRVKKFGFNLDGETSAFDCPISGLLPGLYVVTATNKNQTAHARLIVR